MKVKRVLVDLSRLFVSYCREAGEKEKEDARGTMGRGKREDSSSHFLPRSFYGYPAGASALERELLYIPLRPLVVDFCSGIFLSMNPLKFWYVLQQQP